MKIDIFPPLSINELGHRDNQEDAIAQWEDRLFILCDGMGGHEKGEVASQTVCNSLVTWFSEHVTIDEPFNDQQLKDALEYTYKQLDAKDDGSYKKMGTTLTLLYIHSRGVTAAHIGDSRIYHIRPGKGLLYVSRDHSLVFDLYQSGEITYEEMKTSPQKNVITRAIQPGEENRVRADIIHITDIRPGDYFYLCSDGMLEQMEDHEIAAMFSSKDSDEKKRQVLIADTFDNKDNHSAYIIHVESVKRETDDENHVNEELTARCNALNIKPLIESDASQEDDSEDVVVVQQQQPMGRPLPYPPKKKRSLWPILFLIAILAIGGFVAFSLLTPKEKTESSAPIPAERVDDVKPDAPHRQPITHKAPETQENTPPTAKQRNETKPVSKQGNASNASSPKHGVPPATTTTNENSKKDEPKEQPSLNAEKDNNATLGGKLEAIEYQTDNLKPAAQPEDKQE